MNDLIRQARLLVVDDDARSRRMLERALEPIGCAVTAAAGGREALERLAESGWDAVLLDLNMPDVNGFEVLAWIRERWSMQQLPVVLVTGEDDAESRSRALSLRANDFLAKPVDQPELLARVGTILSYKWAHEELEDKLREDTAARERRSFVTAAVLHDLRSPLAGARGYLELAREELPPGLERVRGFLEAASAAVEGAVSIASDVVDLDQLEDGRIRPVMNPVDLAGLARSRAAFYQGLASRRSVEIRVTGDVTPGACRGDEALLARVFDNLILKAIRHSPERSRVTVALTAGLAPGTVEVSVVDVGPSPDPVDMAHVFERDFVARPDARNRQRASGMGLAFCRSVVTAHGGAIRAETVPGEGFAIRFALPVAVPATGGMASAGSAR